MEAKQKAGYKHMDIKKATEIIIYLKDKFLVAEKTPAEDKTIDLAVSGNVYTFIIKNEIGNLKVIVGTDIVKIIYEGTSGAIVLFSKQYDVMDDYYRDVYKHFIRSVRRLRKVIYDRLAKLREPMEMEAATFMNQLNKDMEAFNGNARNKE